MAERRPPSPPEEETRTTAADSSGDDSRERVETSTEEPSTEFTSVESSDPSSGFVSGGPDLGTLEVIPEKPPEKTLSEDPTQLAGPSQEVSPPKVSNPEKKERKSPLKVFLASARKIKAVLTPKKKISPETRTEESSPKESAKSLEDRPDILDLPSTSSGILSPQERSQPASATSSKSFQPDTFTRSETRVSMKSEPSSSAELTRVSAVTSSSSGASVETEILGPLQKASESKVKQAKTPTGDEPSPRKRTFSQAPVQKGSLDEPKTDSRKQETDVPSELSTSDDESDKDVLLSPKKRKTKK